MYTVHIELQDSVIHSTEPRGVPLSVPMLQEKLKTMDYKTIGIGKWHLGFHQPQYTPTRRGFDEWFGILTGGGGHYSHVSTGTFTMRGTEYKSTQLTYTGYIQAPRIPTPRLPF